jgi:hypothetical protein
MNDNDDDSPCPWPEEPQQGALFEIEGPDEDGCVWLHAGNMTVNLGPRNSVTEVLSQWRIRCGGRKDRSDLRLLVNLKRRSSATRQGVALVSTAAPSRL